MQVSQLTQLVYVPDTDQPTATPLVRWLIHDGARTLIFQQNGLLEMALVRQSTRSICQQLVKRALRLGLSPRVRARRAFRLPRATRRRIICGVVAWHMHSHSVPDLRTRN